MSELRWNSICLLSIYILSIPFYIFGLIKWYKWQNHHIFRVRYSYLALLIISICFIIITLEMIFSILIDFEHIEQNHADEDDTIFESVTDIFIWTRNTIIFYRTNLIFLKWKQYQSRLCSMGINIQSKATSFNESSPTKHWSSRILLGSIIGSVLIMVFMLFVLPEIYGIIALLLWILMFLLGIIIFIIIKIKIRKLELTGLLNECYVLYLTIILYVIINIIFSDQQQISIVTSYILNHILSLFILYFTLYLINKYEKTLRIALLSDHLNDHHVLIDDVKDETKQDNNNHVALTKILSNRKDYEAFSRYLALCFGLENLMFIQKVSIFRWLVMAKKYNQNNVDAAILDEINVNVQYSLKFRYLDHIYNEYNELINKIEADNNDFETFRDVLCSIAHDIYNEFIGKNALNMMNQINISQFKSYDDFLTLFDDSMSRPWKLLEMHANIFVTRTTYHFSENNDDKN